MLLECLQAWGLMGVRLGTSCQAGCSGIGLPGGGVQQGFLNSDPWANRVEQRQAQEFYNQQPLLQQQFRNAQNVPVPPSVSSTPGNQGSVNQGQGFGMSYGVGQKETVTQVTRLLRTRLSCRRFFKVLVRQVRNYAWRLRGVA